MFTFDMNILIIEDNIQVARNIKRMCQKIPVVNNVDIALGFQNGREKAQTGIYDLCLADISGGECSLEAANFIEHLRDICGEMPIIVITSVSSQEYLEKEGILLNATDYIFTPFHAKELELRIQRWLVGPVRQPTTKIAYDKLIYDFDTNEFYFEEKKLSLTKGEKSLLLILLKNSEKLLSSYLIKEKYWGDYSERGRNIRSNIQYLRKSLQPVCADWIRTVRGEGYILKKEKILK